MKKQLLILTVVTLGFVTSSFGQGYMIFGTTGKSWIYDNFSTPGSSQVGGTLNNIDVALMIGAQGASSLIGAGNPTGNTSTLSANTWSSILSDPNFSLVVNQGTGNTAVGAINTAGTTRGGFNYNLGAEFQVAGFGSSLANTTVAMYVIAWNSAYSTPAAAAAANSAVGWSSVFSYTLQKDTSTVPSFLSASGLTAFGVSPVPVPEPATMALAGLGGLALLVIRRRK